MHRFALIPGQGINVAKTIGRLIPEQEKINARIFKIDSNQALIEIEVSVRASWTCGDKHPVQGAAGLPCRVGWGGLRSRKAVRQKGRVRSCEPIWWCIELPVLHGRL